MFLLDGQGAYCGEPALAACEACVRTHGAATKNRTGVADLRSRSAALLERARQVCCATEDVTRRMARYFPACRFDLVTWEDGAIGRPVAPTTLESQERVRVAVIGAIGVHKGYRVLLECARQAALRDLALEFVVLGFTCGDEALLDTGRVFVSGPYQEQELTYLLARERCHLAWFPSVTPEIWCFALSQALRAGMPIVAFDRGALGERLRGLPAVLLLPPDSPVEAINQGLLCLVGARTRDSGAGFARSVAVATARIDHHGSGKAMTLGTGMDPSGDTAPHPTGQIAARDGVQADDAQEAAAERYRNLTEEPSASVQVLRLSEGLYTFGISAGAMLRVAAAWCAHAGAACWHGAEFFCGPSRFLQWSRHGGSLAGSRK